MEELYKKLANKSIKEIKKCIIINYLHSKTEKRR